MESPEANLYGFTRLVLTRERSPFNGLRVRLSSPRPRPQGTCSEAPSGGLKPRTALNSAHALFLVLFSDAHAAFHLQEALDGFSSARRTAGVNHHSCARRHH